MITKNEISSLNLSPTKKDFVQIWNELIEVASKITERWDPTSTNESDPGIVLLKVLAGIADKLNYNIDKNILEAYMPTAAQLDSMQKLCELVGYNIKYYQSAATTVRISYTGDTSAGSEERLPEPGGLAIPKFTTITNADKDITFVTTNTIPLLITNSTPWVEVPCIEGQLSQCESINENNLITLTQLSNNRYYLPEIQIAENGIFVYNAATDLDGTMVDGEAWDKVSNLNTQSSGKRVFKFGYDSFEGRPYLVFPDDVGNLIGDGLFIYFVRTSGLSGNISYRTLDTLEIPTNSAWDDYSAEQFEVINTESTSNGANIESISAAYGNFKKTVGTFDTLVTCRDYMNKIYTLMDASNLPYVSNILVTDIRNDINHAITLCSCNEFGILYKETPLTKTEARSSVINTPSTNRQVIEQTINNEPVNKLVITNRKDTEIITSIEVPEIDHFDLILYPFKTFSQVSVGTKDLVTPYNRSFTYSEQMNKEIDGAISDNKMCAHRLVTPDEGDIVAINNYLRLNALIATSSKVSDVEANDILTNIKVALVNEFNLRNLDFGEEIPFDSILSVIENADARIRVVSLQEPTVLTTYSVKTQKDGEVTSQEYGIVAAETDTTGVDLIAGVDYGYNKDAALYDCTKAKEIYNKLVLRNILAGRASLFNYDDTFEANNAEKPYTVTKNITEEYKTALDSDERDENIVKINEAINNVLSKQQAGDYILYDNDSTTALRGFNNGILTVRVLEHTHIPELSSWESDVNKHWHKCTNKWCDVLLDEGTHDDSTCSTCGYTSQVDDGTVEYHDNPEQTPDYPEEALDTQETPAAYSRLTRQVIYEAQEDDGPDGLEVPETLEDPEGSSDVVVDTPTKAFIFLLYETYEYVFNKPTQSVATFKRTRNTPATSNGIFSDIKRVEAVCEIHNSKEPTFNNIELKQNEVIKFRAPNLITTKTFPAYVYYRFEKGATTKTNSTASGSKTSGSYAQISRLTTFISSLKTNREEGYERFFKKLWELAGSNLKTFNARVMQTTGNISQANEVNTIFNTAIVVGADGKFFANPGDVNNYLAELVGSSTTEVTFTYYPLNNGTINTWSECIRSFNPRLPKGTTLWRLSSSTTYPKGKYVIETGQRIFAQSGEFLTNGKVGDITYICTDLGTDPTYRTIPENSDIELGSIDKLYIHYTPSSTNEDGETVNAEPISVVYTGSAENPIILKPTGFSLMNTEDVLTSQGISPKKTVEFTGYGKKDLLALAPNEQIEMRSISRVVLNKPARFYKNFTNEKLERGSSSEPYSYELKDGEYVFYTDQNTQEAAYYGSGSVITLAPGAYIPKASEQVEVSQILEQGLHIIPWGSVVLLTDSKTVTVTEYQYVTLTAGDTLKTLTVEANGASDNGGYTISNNWVKCLSTEEKPIAYQLAGEESPTELPKLELASGAGWEVCSLLELSTAPGYAQPLRATTIELEDTGESGTNIITREKVLATDLEVTTVGTSLAQEKLEKTIDYNLIIKTPTGEELSLTSTLTDLLDIGKVGFDLSEQGIKILYDAATNSIAFIAEEDSDFSVTESIVLSISTIEEVVQEDDLVPSTLAVTNKVNVYFDTGTSITQPMVIAPQKTIIPVDAESDTDEEVFETVSIKLDTIAQTASGGFEKPSTAKDTKIQLKVFKEEPPTIIELDDIDMVLTPISEATVAPAETTSAKLNNYWSKIDISSALFSSPVLSEQDPEAKKPRALNLNFMIPENSDIFGIFSIYLDVPEDRRDPGSVQGIPKSDKEIQSRVFIDVPTEFDDAISIYNYTEVTKEKTYHWWSEGVDANTPNRLYLRTGLNCIKVTKSCNILIKAQQDAAGSLLYDNLRLVKGINTNGVNLELLDVNAASINGYTYAAADTELASLVLDKINELDKNHDFYYNVPIENGLAIEFDDGSVSSFSSPYTLYDINNINNSFVVSKLDIDYLDTGLRIAKSSRY